MRELAHGTPCYLKSQYLYLTGFENTVRSGKHLMTTQPSLIIIVISALLSLDGKEPLPVGRRVTD